MAYHYVTSSQPPTSVTHAVVCNFTGADEKTLIIGKSTRLEAHRIEGGELAPIFDVAVYGRIATIDVLSAAEDVRERLSLELEPVYFRSFQSTKPDKLFILTERHQFFVLSFDPETQDLLTEAYGDARVSAPNLNDFQDTTRQS